MNVKLVLDPHNPSDYNSMLAQVEKEITLNIRDRYSWSYGDFVLFKAAKDRTTIEISIPIIISYDHQTKKSNWNIVNIARCIDKAKKLSVIYHQDRLPHQSIIGYVPRDK